MATSFRVHYQFPNLLFRGGTLDGHCERDTLKGGAGAFQAHFVRHVKRATNVDFTILYWNIVQVREPRNLREQSKCRAYEKIRQRGGSFVSATPFLRFIGLEAKTSDRPLQMNPFNDIRYRPNRYIPLFGPVLAFSRNLSISTLMRSKFTRLLTGSPSGILLTKRSFAVFQNKRSR